MAEPPKPPIGFRDVFFREWNKLTRHDFTLMLAEDADPLTDDAGYRDLLAFERDIAQVVGLILLFVESPGSLAELGAFAALSEVAPSLLAVVTDEHYARVSFIKNGPIRYLEHEFGEESVLSLDTEHISWSDGRYDQLNLVEFMREAMEATKRRLDQLAKYRKLNTRISGHAILLMTGLCQEFGALRAGEIKDYLKQAGFEEINDERFRNFVYCAELLGWIKKIRKGHNVFYAATDSEHAIQYKFLPGATNSDKDRWRSDLRVYWKNHDVSRFRAISDALVSADG